MKGNFYKRDYAEDKEARGTLTKNARLRHLRADKKASRKKTRQVGKKLLTNIG